MLSTGYNKNISSVQSLVMSDSVAPWTAAGQASLSITNSQSLLKLVSIELVMPSNYLMLWHPLLFLPSIFPSIGLFQWVRSLHQVAKILELQLQHQSFQWILRLISFRKDWLDLLAVQRTLKSLLQHHSSKYQFFHARLSSWSNPHIHTWLQEKTWLWLDGALLAK